MWKMVSGVLVFALIVAAGRGDAQAPRPNIVLCMADDQGWEEVGYNGHAHLKTPVLDEMARTGFRFDRFYSASSNCGPTRGSVMTGRHAFRFGLFGPNWAMRPEEITIAEILKDHGYATGHFGKWHLGPVKAGAPNNPGASGFDQWLAHDNFFGIHPTLSRNGAPPRVFRGESSEIVVREASEFIRSSTQAGTPFLAVVWFGSPHSPYDASPADRAPYAHLDNDLLPERYGEIAAVDRSVGRLRTALRDLRIHEDTLLWYCSDNGVPHPSKHNARLNGSKGNLFEGGVRVPGLIEWPGGITEPGSTTTPCVTSDILPTLCDVLQIPLPNRVLDGVSLLPLIRGARADRTRPICFWHYEAQPESANPPWLDPITQVGTTPTTKRQAILFRNFSHPTAATEDFVGDAAILDGRFKLILDRTGRHRKAKHLSPPVNGDVALFDLSADPGEAENLAEQRPNVVARLTRQLREWQASVERSMTGADYAAQ